MWPALVRLAKSQFKKLSEAGCFKSTWRNEADLADKRVTFLDYGIADRNHKIPSGKANSRASKKTIFSIYWECKAKVVEKKATIDQTTGVARVSGRGGTTFYYKTDYSLSRGRAEQIQDAQFVAIHNVYGAF